MVSGYCWPHKMNCFLLYFLKMWVWCYFFLKHLIQFTSKLSGLDISLGRVLIMNSNSLIDKTLWLFSFIVCPFWSTVICQAVCPFHLCCQTDWHEYNTFFLFFCFIIYYFSYFFHIWRFRGDTVFFILYIHNLFSSFLFLINLTGIYQFCLYFQWTDFWLCWFSVCLFSMPQIFALNVSFLLLTLGLPSASCSSF